MFIPCFLFRPVWLLCDTYLIFSSTSWQKTYKALPKPLDVHSGKVVNANKLTAGWGPLGCFNLGTGHWKDQGILRGERLSAHLPTSREGRGAGGYISHQCQWFNQLCLCNKASIKSLKDRVRELAHNWMLSDAWRLVCTCIALCTSPI
jgi:hypothetical protein